MEHVGGKTAFGVGGLAFVDLCFLRGAKLDLELFA